MKPENDAGFESVRQPPDVESNYDTAQLPIPASGDTSKERDASNPNSGPDETSPFLAAGGTTVHAVTTGELPRAFGRYHLRKLLGKGGMGRVYLAHDPELRRDIALKMPSLVPQDLPSEMQRRADLKRRLLREAKLAAALSHPNICRIFDVGEIDDTVFLTMELIDGRSLSAKLKERFCLPIGEAADVICKVADAMQAAHDKGIIHRDLKPLNVLMRRDVEPVVTDFGLAHPLAGEEWTKLTQTGAVLGSPAYMAPEQIDPDLGGPCPASDIYSLGAMFFELLVGRPPFIGIPSAVFGKHVHAPPPLPSDFRAEIPNSIERVCLKALEKDARSRFASMHEFSSSIVEALSHPRPRQTSSHSGVVLSIKEVVKDIGKVVSNEIDGDPQRTPPAGARVDRDATAIVSVDDLFTMLVRLQLVDSVDLDIVKIHARQLDLNRPMQDDVALSILRSCESKIASWSHDFPFTTPVLTSYQIDEIFNGRARRLAEFANFRVLNLIGEGGMGRVYLARGLGPFGLPKYFAIKTIRNDDLNDNAGSATPLSQSSNGAADLMRFKEETSLLARIDHPNIVRVVAADASEDGTPFMAMDYVAGKDLAHVVAEAKEAGALVDWRRAIETVVVVAEAIDALHSLCDSSGKPACIIHRNIKPSNVVLKNGKVPMLIDLGIAHFRREPANVDEAFPEDGASPTGTPAFMPLEQWVKADSVTPASDIYALAGTLFFLLTGSLPFPADDAQSLLHQVMTADRPRVSQWRRDIPRRARHLLDSVIAKAMAINLEHRYQRATEFAKALRQVQGSSRWLPRFFGG